jgi:ATP-binding cassette subfamily C protein CydC
MLTAVENVSLPLVLDGMRTRSADARAEELLCRVGLGAWLDGLADGVDTHLGSDATTISGGERRRLLIARALLAPAGTLLVDEPAEHLDPQTADALVGELVTEAHGGRENSNTQNGGTEDSDTQNGGGRAVVLATHRLSALDRVDEVILLGKPDPDKPTRIIARGPHRELLAQPDYRWALDQEAAD